MEKRNISGVIMCGGKGSRFHSPKDTQKCIYQLGNTSTLGLIIDKFLEKSISPIYFLTGYDAEATENYIRSFINGRTKCVFIREQKQGGTARSIAAALTELPQQFIYSHGNLLLHNSVYEELLISVANENITKIVVQPFTKSLTHPVLNNINGKIFVARAASKPSSNWKTISGLSYIKKEDLRPENIDIRNAETTEELFCAELTEENLLINKYPIFHIERLEDLSKFEAVLDD